MTFLQRRTLLAAGATLATALFGRKLLSASRVPVALQPPGPAVPDITFLTADGATQTLKDYAGKGIVLNFWATWCVPCVKEMPDLAKLAALVKGSNVVVLPLSSDRGGAPVVQRFYDEKGIKDLPILLDPRSAAVHAVGARGLPTTLLIDASGHERARLEGAVEWTDEAAVAAVKALAG